jgi:hypothetical protein
LSQPLDSKGDYMSKELKAMAASWARSFLAAGVAVYMAGVTDPADIAKAGLAAVLPVILRYLNPSDTAFGKKA